MFLAIGILDPALAPVTARFQASDRRLGTLRILAEEKLRAVCPNVLLLGYSFQRIILIESNEQTQGNEPYMIDEWSL
jgi:hypothetical protein